MTIPSCIALEFFLKLRISCAIGQKLGNLVTFFLFQASYRRTNGADGDNEGYTIISIRWETPGANSILSTAAGVPKMLPNRSHRKRM